MNWFGVAADDKYSLADKMDVLWPKIEHLVEDALIPNRGEFSAEDINRFIRLGEMQLWVIGDFEGVCVTELRDFPQATFCYVVLFAGVSMSNALPLFEDVIVPWARERGANGIRALTRPGLNRLLKGWTKAYDVMEFAL